MFRLLLPVLIFLKNIVIINSVDDDYMLSMILGAFLPDDSSPGCSSPDVSSLRTALIGGFFSGAFFTILANWARK